VDPDTTYAYLCDSCFKFTRSGNQDKSPPMSLVTGVDYGLAHIHMPELSFIEKLLLCTSQPYGHMFMLGGKSRGGQVGIKGHMVTMKTNTGNITASIALQHERVSLPRTEFHMQFMYVGNMDKWNSIKNTDNGRVEFIQLFGKILEIKSDKLYLWINMLTTVYRELYPANMINNSLRNQTDADNLLNGLFEGAIARDENSIHSLINDQASLNVPGAESGESEVDPLHPSVEHRFLDADDPLGNEDIDLEIRKNMFINFQTRLLNIIPGVDSSSSSSSSVLQRDDENNDGDENNDNEEMKDGNHHEEEKKDSDDQEEEKKMDVDNPEEKKDDENNDNEEMKDGNYHEDEKKDSNDQEEEKKMDVDNSEEKKDDETHRFQYATDGIGNDYTDARYTMSGTFPSLFPCGYPYTGKAELVQVQHMIKQASNRFTSGPA
jgi:hypothetical protein